MHPWLARAPSKDHINCQSEGQCIADLAVQQKQLMDIVQQASSGAYLVLDLVGGVDLPFALEEVGLLGQVGKVGDVRRHVLGLVADLVGSALKLHKSPR